MKMISEAVRDLVQYGLDTGLLDEEDRYYARNQILRLLGLTEYEETESRKKNAAWRISWRRFWTMRQRTAFWSMTV